MTKRVAVRTERDLFVLLIRNPGLLRDGPFSLVEGAPELKSNRSRLASGAQITASYWLCNHKQLAQVFGRSVFSFVRFG